MSSDGKELLYNVLAGNIFIMELREEFSVCRNNEALSRVRVYFTSHFILGKGKCQTEGNKIVREQGINKT